MATKAQIARKKYGCSLNELTAGEKAAVTRAFNAQGNVATPVSNAGNAGMISVTFVRAGGRSIVSKVPAGSTYKEALENVTSFQFNPDKEGLQNMSGVTISLLDKVASGNVLVAPNIDSAY